MSAEEICSRILAKIVPERDEEERVARLAEDVKRRVEGALKKLGLRADVRIDGSVAKGTWLSGEADVDIFMRFPPAIKRRRFRTICLDIAKEAFKGVRAIERYAEHPYIEAWIEGVRVNVVPCYAVEPPNWLSATDRTPYHTMFVKERLTAEARDQVRLLKRFMKGIGVYGAEIKVGGFSGYLCELLILHYGSFLNVLRSAPRLRKDVIDLAGHYRGREGDARRLFIGDPMTVIDPIDPRRNVAAAVQRQRLSEFIVAARFFLERPSETFFYPPEVKLPSREGLLEALRARGSDLLFVRLDGTRGVPDVLWGQLYRSQRALQNLLERYEFRVLRSSVWSDEARHSIFVFELEQARLPPTKVHVGPPINSKRVEEFVEKWSRSARTVAGPWIERDRLYVEIKRSKLDAAELVRELLARDGGKGVGVADYIADVARARSEVLLNEGIADFYLTNREFAKFLMDFLAGKPSWLE